MRLALRRAFSGNVFPVIQSCTDYKGGFRGFRHILHDTHFVNRALPGFALPPSRQVSWSTASENHEALWIAHDGKGEESPVP